MHELALNILLLLIPTSASRWPRVLEPALGYSLDGSESHFSSTAMTSISTSTSLGRRATSTHERAGLFSPQYSA